MSVRLLLAIVLAVLAGCTRGPDEAQVRKGLEERLAQALPPGTVSQADLERRGSQADTKAPAGETRRIVYFDAELRLGKDFDFGAWNAPGMAGLVSALGAGPKGITGIRSGGNKAGDVIHAHGTALYRRDGSRWAGVAPAGHAPASAPAYATSAPQRGPRAILEAMREVVDSVPAGASPLETQVIEEELAFAHASIRARLARAREGYALAAGPENGQYLRFAQALSGAGGPPVVPLVTRGGEQNLRLLREGRVTLALAQGDVALDAYEGRGSFAQEGPQPSLRAIGSLYPEPVHVLVRSDSAFSSIAELRGRRIAIGQPGSASRTTAVRVLEAHGLTLRDIEPLELSPRDGLVGLMQDGLQAVIQVIGVPADSIRDAIAAVPLRLLPLSKDGVEKLAGAGAGQFAYTIARGAYPGQREDIATIATAALLLTGRGLSETEVGTITRFVFEGGQDFAARGSAQGVQVSAATARQGLSIPLHVTAAEALDAMR